MARIFKSVDTANAYLKSFYLIAKLKKREFRVGYRTKCLTGETTIYSLRLLKPIIQKNRFH